MDGKPLPIMARDFKDRLYDKNNKGNNDQQKIMQARTTMLQGQIDLKTTDCKTQQCNIALIQ